MKKTIIWATALGTLSLFTTQSFAQTVISEQNTDSVSTYQTTPVQPTSGLSDEARIDSAKRASDLANAKAAEARRIEEDADAAARESRASLKKEVKAKKARERADRQARRAADARRKSDENL